jgi:23S rRNA (adenine2503-C2)-methyltransferase
MEIVKVFGKDELAKVYLARLDSGEMVEFAESVQPPIPRDEKWVLIVSTLLGCPVKCKMCDASGHYKGKLSARDILSQIDVLITNRFLNRKVPIPKLKVQFARMGEPSFNSDVLTVLRRLPSIYEAPGLMPCISTIAPVGTEDFFEELISIKNELYPFGYFQLQFSVHTTKTAKRDYLMPAKKWSLKQIACYGERFFDEGDRKVAINFAVMEGFPVDADVLARYFDPEVFIVKLTPLNPTGTSKRHKLKTGFADGEGARALAQSIEKHGFESIISIGEMEENSIGSNCGQYISRYLNEQNEFIGAEEPKPSIRRIS